MPGTMQGKVQKVRKNVKKTAERNTKARNEDPTAFREGRLPGEAASNRTMGAKRRVRRATRQVGRIDEGLDKVRKRLK